GMFVLAASGAGSISIDTLLRWREQAIHPWLRAMM
ncbi:quinol oxidase, partial [Mesorhizobium sp. M1A.T.Ca.IN.004.03.1.1]